MMDDPVFKRVLGADFEHLPSAVRRAHDHSAVRLTGQADVATHLGTFGKVFCWIMGFPASGTGIPVSVSFTPASDGSVHWCRNFGGR